MDRTQLENDVLKIVETKSVLKRNVFELSKQRFTILKQVLKDVVEEWEQKIRAIDDRLEVSFKDTGPYYAQVTIAGDTLVFALHTNVFCFPQDSLYWKSGYLQENTGRGYCGTIQVYNFLADSFRFQRMRDIGYMVARVLLNVENHFFVEGKRELGYLFNDFVNAEFTEDKMREVIISIIKYTLEFDLYIPSYKEVAEINVGEAISLKDAIDLKTGKRLGFQFGVSEESVQG